MAGAAEEIHSDDCAVGSGEVGSVLGGSPHRRVAVGGVGHVGVMKVQSALSAVRDETMNDGKTSAKGKI